ncbi:hypothetical protein [Paracoccus sp. (in: a-proteobacteria)]|uniref:hypothetical protein n=1 Tax=Paracoccus sp. TaxID=267 RepID=UPI0026E01494|nr:hypothetical protein [Paracoccus sp. (in: a-proteobacteria)]MDO5648225.1 hypothetical protein [Paracoccus sp. (in: a-proteobacteria)]
MDVESYYALVCMMMAAGAMIAALVSVFLNRPPLWMLALIGVVVAGCVAIIATDPYENTELLAVAFVGLPLLSFGRMGWHWRRASYAVLGFAALMLVLYPWLTTSYSSGGFLRNLGYIIGLWIGVIPALVGLTCGLTWRWLQNQR